MDCTLDNLQEMANSSQQEALHKWFDEICKSMDEVELRTSITRQIEYSEVVKELEPAAEAEIPKVPDIVKSGFHCSWLAHILKKPYPIVLKSQDHEVILFQDKFQADMEKQKADNRSCATSTVRSED